jgi:hypothetical protein
MEAEDIIGKEITCFKFESDERLGWNSDYDEALGKTGTVLRLHDRYPQYARVKVHTSIGKTTEIHFPTQMIIDQLQFENKSTEELLNDMKSLLTQI